MSLCAEYQHQGSGIYKFQYIFTGIIANIKHKLRQTNDLGHKKSPNITDDPALPLATRGGSSLQKHFCSSIIIFYLTFHLAYIILRLYACRI